MSVSGMSTSELVIQGTPVSLWRSKQGCRVQFNAHTADAFIRVSDLTEAPLLQAGTQKPAYIEISCYQDCK